MKSSSVTVTKFVNGVAQTPTIHAASKGGYAPATGATAIRQDGQVVAVTELVAA